MNTSHLEKIIASIPRVRVTRDTSGDLRVVDAAEVPGQAVDGAASGGCVEPFTSVETVPVLLPLSAICSKLDPRDWTLYCMINTSDAKIEAKCRPRGWRGTIVETLDFRDIDYVNKLNVKFRYSDTASRVDFSLAAARGENNDLTVDQGFFEALPGPILPRLTCSKTVNFQSDSPECKLSRDFIEAEVVVFVFIFVLEYSLRMTLDQLEKGLAEEERAFVDDNWEHFLSELATFGLDAETETFSGLIDYLNRRIASEKGVPRTRSRASADDGKKKIAVLGGGMGSLSAVYHLTSQPDWKNKYEITVYQLGWRLGGKAASGRNRKLNDRNEEDGIHVFFGYYANALAMMRECYGELGRPSWAPLATFGDAFKPLDFSVLEERMPDGSWVHWPLCPPFGLGRNGSGDPRQGDPGLGDPGLGEVFRAGVGNLLDQAEALGRLLPGASFLRSAGDVLERILSPRGGGANEYTGLLTETWHRALEPILAAAELAAVTVWTFNQDFIRMNDALARAWISFNFNFALVRGIVRDRVLVRGIRSINDRDFAEWIGDHAVDDGGLTRSSAFVRVPYSTFFAYENGHNTRPSIEAGTALRTLLLGSLCHRGVAYWKMQAGTGDTVFAPLYQVLVKRGVRFEFFRRVEKLETSRDADGRRVESVVLRKQATVRGGRAYEPLYDVKGLPCWPSEPLYEQLEEGADLEQEGVDLEGWWSDWSRGTSRLLAGKDFDTLILGIGLGALPGICSELAGDDERWRRMFATQKTVRTVALQLWTRQSLSELGWPPNCLYPGEPPVLSTYDRQATGTLFNTWLQMDQLLERENWPADGPRGLAYFCGKMHEDPAAHDGKGLPQDLRRRLLRYIERFLRLNLPHLWPEASKGPGHFDFHVLLAGAEAAGHERVEAQYFKANVNPSERYVQTVVGSSRHRLRTDGSGCSNLFLVGDWIDNGLNVGSIEAAVMAGMLCSNAVSGKPGLDEIRHLNFLDEPYEE